MGRCGRHAGWARKIPESKMRKMTVCHIVDLGLIFIPFGAFCTQLFFFFDITEQNSFDWSDSCDVLIFHRPSFRFAHNPLTAMAWLKICCSRGTFVQFPADCGPHLSQPALKFHNFSSLLRLLGSGLSFHAVFSLAGIFCATQPGQLSTSFPAPET